MAIRAQETPEKLQAPANTPRKDWMALGKHIKTDIGGDRIVDCAKRRVKQRLPYHRNDKIQMLSRVTEKRYGSSYPMAYNVYKANSDEFKAPKRTKKIKKSVHTLPNDPSPMPQTCTVSDINETEYHEDESVKSKSRKKVQSRKNRIRRRDYEYYDRDAQHCSDLECSSTEIIKKYGGDGKVYVKPRDVNGKSRNDLTSHQDMWAVLRNINKFQFRPSPRISEDNLGLSPKKKSTFVKRHTDLPNGRRLIETCRTAEVSYVANFEFNGNLPQIDVTPSISGDRITVIENSYLQNKNEPKDKTNSAMLNIVKPRSPLTIRERDSNRNAPRSTNFKAAAIREYNKYVPLNKCIPENRNVTPRYYRSSSTKLSTGSSGCLRSKDNSRILEPSEKVYFDFGHFKGKDKPEQLGKLDMQRPHQVTMMPRMTDTEIKRKLNHYKFPLVVLGKDQISSPMVVYNYDPPQFDGLDKHIWPYMAEWTRSESDKGHEIDHVTNNLRRMSLEVHKKPNNTFVDSAGNKKSEHKRLSQQLETIPHPLSPKKSKPIRHFKDKMLKLLYKKPSPSEAGRNEVQYVKAEKVDACTEPFIESLVESKQQPELLKSLEKHQEVIFNLGQPKKPKEIVNSLENQTKCIFMPNKQRWYPGRVGYTNWSKGGKWELIENIIHKIKNGVYYNYDEDILSIKHGEVNFMMKTSSEHRIKGGREDIHIKGKLKKNNFPRPSDTLTTVINCIDTSITEIADTVDVKIPGFDDNVDILRELEINSLTFNKIAIKHRLTNVIVQFDVTLPNKSRDIVLDVKNSYSFVPLAITESNTRVFKCNTKIVNAILPAELCSVIPKLMREFIDSEAHLALFPTPSPDTQVQCSCANSDTDLYSICNVDPCNVLGLYDIPNVISYDIMSPVLRKTLVGKFMAKIFTPCVCCKLKFVNHKAGIADVTNALSALPSPIPIFLCIVSPLDFLMPKANSEELTRQEEEEELEESNCRTLPSNCTALQVYAQKVSYSDDMAYPYLMDTIRTFYSFNLTFYDVPHHIIHPLTLKCDMMLTKMNDLIKNISATISTTNKKLMFSQFFDMNINDVPQIGFASEASDKIVTEVLPRKARNGKVAFALYETNINGKPDFVSDLLNKTGKKEKQSRKHRYIKLYKKCKSTSNLTGEKFYTPLSKVTNLDEFFKVVGSVKTMACVFDGQSEKIMAAIDELKIWISEITPRQAMLVLLLTNKKDTPSLIRFRPVLLQGIAVNRITRATELNMEIEVIETENVGLAKQYEGIDYIPASIENQQSLFEELCWIAKNTASDYHKTFDESSEKLLKSLIQKRKKLNPSYLRVVARYVGLGLLKRKN